MIICISYLCSFTYSQSIIQELKLDYSVLHRVQGSDTITSIESGAIISDGDNLKINVQFKNNFTCYVIYEDPDHNIAFLYNSSSDSLKKISPYFYNTKWLKFSPPLGIETLYFILSQSPLITLEKVVVDLGVSSGGRARKFFKRFTSEINKLSSPNKNSTLLTTRLDKPIVGGVTFRGDEGEINAYSLTHEIRRSNVDVIIKTITFQHE